jgi:hypothetical protein
MPVVLVSPTPAGTRAGGRDRRRRRWRRWPDGRRCRGRRRRRGRLRSGRGRRVRAWSGGRPRLWLWLWLPPGLRRPRPSGVWRTHGCWRRRARPRGAHGDADELSGRVGRGFCLLLGDRVSLASRGGLLAGRSRPQQIERVELDVGRLESLTDLSRRHLGRGPAGLHGRAPQVPGAHRRSNERGQPQSGGGKHRGKCGPHVRRHAYLIARLRLRPGSSRAPSPGRARCRPLEAARPPTAPPRARRRRSSPSRSPSPCPQS